jgi:hypothetical protein
MTVSKLSPRNSPPGWEKLGSLLGAGKTPVDLGFSDKVAAGDLNRAMSRYRLCKSFKGVSLDGYSQDTTAGYSALFKLFLTWSAFECFLSCINLTRENCDQILRCHEPIKLAGKIRDVDREQVFWKFIQSKLHSPKQKQELEDAYHGKRENITILASSVRHVFAHGPLTPNANGTSPRAVIQICNTLSSFLIKIMDSEIKARVSRIGE